MELNFKSFGSGPALVILHGLFGSLDNWQSLAKQFAKDYSVYIVDQRNHGKSPHKEQFDYPTLAEDLVNFLDQQGIYQSSIIGHSMGGKTAMQFAMDSSDRIEKMVVVDMAPVTYPPHHTQILEALNAFPLEKITNRQDADDFLQPLIPDFAVRQFLLKNLQRSGGSGFEWKFNLASISKQYEKILAGLESSYAIDTPTLFLSGGKSEYVKPEYHDEIREMFPEAQFQVVDDAGHWVHAEAPGEFMERVKGFLGG